MSNGPSAAASTGPDDEEEEDYMKMVFIDAPAAPETSLQRRERLRREGALRGRIKSKAELAEEEAFKRETALATSLLENPETSKNKSKGFAMMAKMGFKVGSALGPSSSRPATGGNDGGGASGEREGGGGGSSSGSKEHEDTRLREPLRIFVREDRGGIGLDNERKRKVREAAEGFAAGTKRAKAEEGEFRDRVRRDREVARQERQLRAAQRIAELMSLEEANGDGENDSEGVEADNHRPCSPPEAYDNKRGESSPPGGPLKSINVLWRGLVRAREEAERDRQARQELRQGFTNVTTRLPRYDDDADEDDDDKMALGRDIDGLAAPASLDVNETDKDDPELDEFEARDVGDRLWSVVDHLRAVHLYCFWCKSRYPDRDMDGCPGLSEEDHD